MFQGKPRKDFKYNQKNKIENITIDSNVMGDHALYMRFLNNLIPSPFTEFEITGLLKLS